MPRIKRSKRAKLDMTQIWLHIGENNFPAANQFISRINETLDMLAKFPGAGQMRDDLAPALRSFPVGKYLLLFTRIKGGISLVRVVHGARDLPALFND